MLLKLLIALLCFIVYSNTNAIPKVKTPLEELKGYKISQDDRKYEAYEGISYALPSIEKLRFKVYSQIIIIDANILKVTFLEIIFLIQTRNGIL